MSDDWCESADMGHVAIGGPEGETPLFSVCVPVYNAESYLREACASIFLQSVADYEVILVDDGSTDGSGEACDAIAAENNRVSVIHQENMGLLCARRAAIKRARGGYIVTLDADDLLRPDALELLSRVVRLCEPDFVLFPFPVRLISRSFNRAERLSDRAITVMKVVASSVVRCFWANTRACGANA